MNEQQLDELIQWLPAEIEETEIINLLDQSLERFPAICPDNLARAIGRLYGIPI